jgi:L-seryl-tRNA(Ser) seleniumtransferase
MLFNEKGLQERLSLGRREILKATGFLTAGTFLANSNVSPSSIGALSSTRKNVYTRIGVRPLINCKGTFTIITGSLTLPEVKQAMHEASQYYVHLDELMEAVGERLAEITGAEWGIVTAGCSDAETLATCACVAGGDPENIQRLPNMEGLKDEVIIPGYSRNVYDHAVRMVGVRLITVNSMDELEAALGPRSAMVYILACPDDQGELGVAPISRAARERGVPVFVDAAAEGLTPEVHLRRGADLVAYSGGKALRGPQCAGLLLGRKDLCQAAWLHSAPHHAFGRSMKVGKEEIMGMLAAAECWYQRDHKAEWRLWESWLDTIAKRVGSLPGVWTEVLQPGSLSNYAPRLAIRWNGNRTGISGEDVSDVLLAGDPRIILASGRGRFPDQMENCSVEVMPWMMQEGNSETVAQALLAVLSDPPEIDRRQSSDLETVQIGGRWEAVIEYVSGQATHNLYFEQDDQSLLGSHQGRTISGSLRGTVNGNHVEFRSSQPYEGTLLRFHFGGEVSGNSMRGTAALGEYGSAKWSAHRYQYA